MGMIEDFGVLGLNEAMNRPGESFAQIHRRVFASVWWSAVTSSAVFGALGLSTLPGIAQMGVLTGLGILRRSRRHALWIPARGDEALCGALSSAVPESESARSTVWPGVVIAAIALVCMGTLIGRGMPRVANGTSVLRPKNCQSFEALMNFDAQMKSRTVRRWSGFLSSFAVATKRRCPKRCNSLRGSLPPHSSRD